MYHSNALIPYVLKYAGRLLLMVRHDDLSSPQVIKMNLLLMISIYIKLAIIKLSCKNIEYIILDV